MLLAIIGAQPSSWKGKPTVNPSPITSPDSVGGGGVHEGVGVGVGIQGVNTSAVASVPTLKLNPPAQTISLLPEMNAPDGNERVVFMSADVVHWSRDGSYT